MARPKSPPRVCGPYEERGGTRFRIRVIGNGTEKNLYFPTRAEALAAKDDAERELLSPATYVISDLIVEFAEDKQSQGSCKPETAAHELGRLQFFLARHLDEDIRDITPKRAEEIYRTATTVISPKTGKPLEAASHRFYLNLAKRFFGWAEKKGYLQANAFKAVRPVGRPNAGKPQLRIDEANRFVATALQMFDEGGDVLALAAVVALLTLGFPLIGALLGRPARPLPRIRLAEDITGRAGQQRLVAGSLSGDGFRRAPLSGSAMLRGLADSSGYALIPAEGARSGDSADWLALP